MHQLDRPCSRTRTRARRALLAASVAAAALVLPARPAAADSYIANTSGPIQVNGTYRPIVGNFSGDERDDIFWYAPGSGAEQLWIATGLPSQPFDKQPGDSVNGTYTPLVGNFGGDAYEEILWYAPGTATDILWTNPAGYFEPKSIRIAVLIDRTALRKTQIVPEWSVFRIETEQDDRFLVGYGLDYADYYRGLPYLGILQPPAAPLPE